MLKRSLLILGVWIFILLFWTLPGLAEMIVDTTWVRRYNGPANMTDKARAIDVDRLGNVYVTGSSMGIGTFEDYATIKYLPNGDTAWIRRYNGAGDSSDGATALAVDDSGNVYVTGSIWGEVTDFDFATIKYNSEGDTLWVRYFNNIQNGMDGANALVVDMNGHVHVSGLSFGGTFRDATIIKYQYDGDTAWIRQYNGPANDQDDIYDLEVDQSGNVCVTGFTRVAVGDEDYLTIKYFPNGDTAWVRTYKGSANREDRACAIAVDLDGNIYVTGFCRDSVTQNDYVTIKYYPDGDTAWVRQYDGPANTGDHATTLAVDAGGNVYVTGLTSNGTFNYTTLKYNTNGDLLWDRHYDGAAHNWDFALDLSLDDSGNVYVTGAALQGPTSWDYTTIKYRSNGEPMWVAKYNGPGNAVDSALVVTVDTQGNVYVTGYSLGSGTGKDYATIKYSETGIWRGDVNRDGIINAGDVVYLINYLFIDGPAPDLLQTGNTNCDEVINIADVVYLINYLFISGPPPDCW